MMNSPQRAIRNQWLMARPALGLLVLFVLNPAGRALAQSSSLFVQSQRRAGVQMAATTQPAADGVMKTNAGAMMPQAAPFLAVTQRNVSLAQFSLTAVTPPEPRIIRVNDFIGVIVRHHLRYQTDARLDQKSRWDWKAKLDGFFRIHDRKLVEQDFERGIPEIKFKNQNDMQNQGTANRKDIFEVRLKAKVIDVKPNGNLTLFALTQVKIDDEDQFITLTGECNKSDIEADGNVVSDKIFNLIVKTDNDGAVRDAVKRGWLKEFLDMTKPF
jgi:flagellar basal body L-ring protein FlgH